MIRVSKIGGKEVSIQEIGNRGAGYGFQGAGLDGLFVDSGIVVRGFFSATRWKSNSITSSFVNRRSIFLPDGRQALFLQHPFLLCLGHQTQPVLHIKFLEHVINMSFNGVLGVEKYIGDFLISKAFGNILQYFALLGR